MNSEQESVNGDQLAVNNGQESVSNEEELEKLKEANQQQAAEVERLKKEVEELKSVTKPLRPDGHLPLAGEELLKETLSKTQGQSLNIPKQDSSATLCGRDARVPSASATLKTQGVRPSREDGMGTLHTAARRAAQSNSRSDVAEYMRLRRNFI